MWSQEGEQRVLGREQSALLRSALCFTVRYSAAHGLTDEKEREDDKNTSQAEAKRTYA